MNRTRWIALSAGLLALVVVIALVRSGRDSGSADSGRTKGKPARKGYYVPPNQAPPPAPPDVMASSMEEARVRSTYQNYRNAVALGHRRLMESFRKSLLREPEIAVRIAEAELAAAKDQYSQDIARKAL